MLYTKGISVWIFIHFYPIYRKLYILTDIHMDIHKTMVFTYRYRHGFFDLGCLPLLEEHDDFSSLEFWGYRLGPPKREIYLSIGVSWERRALADEGFAGSRH